jgi:hypothetical protein
MFEACCEIAVDARGRVTEFTPRTLCRDSACCSSSITVARG